MNKSSFPVVGVAVVAFLGVAGVTRVGTVPVVPPVGESGVNPVTVLVTMSTFSALATNVMTDQELESRLGSGGTARVLLFAGRESEQAVVDGSFDKLTTMLRRDDSVEVNIPTGNGLYAGAEDLPVGWSYAVQLEPNVSACCDGGDNQCEHRQGASAPGAVNRSIAQLRPQVNDERRLMLTLTQLPAPLVTGSSSSGSSYGDRQPSALIRVASVATPSPSETPADAGGGTALPFTDAATMMCTLRVGDAVVATGQLRSPGAPDSSGQQTIGTLDLTYRR